MIYNKFKPAFYYWRLVLFVRKMLLSIGAVFLVEFPVLQGTLALLVMFVFYSLHLTYKPYLVGLPKATSEKENMEELVAMELCKGMSAGQRKTFGQIRSTKQLLDEAMLGIIFHDIDKDKSGNEQGRGADFSPADGRVYKGGGFLRGLSKAGFIKATSPLLLQANAWSKLVLERRHEVGLRKGESTCTISTNSKGYFYFQAASSSCALSCLKSVNRNVDTGARGRAVCLDSLYNGCHLCCDVVPCQSLFEDTFRSYKHYKHVMEEGKQRAKARSGLRRVKRRSMLQGFHHRASR